MQAVAEGVGDRHFAAVPRRGFQPRPGEAILLADQFAMQRRYVLDLDAHGDARRAIAVMFAQMQDAAVAGYTHIERCIVVEAVLELDLETEEVEIELTRLGDVEDAQDGRDGPEFRHGADT